jgi:hypothetical protein
VIVTASQTEFWLVVVGAYGLSVLLACALFRGWVR